MTENSAIKCFDDTQTIESLIKECKFCHLAIFDEQAPYILGMNFGYKDKTLYFHSAKEGKKIELLRKNNSVSVFFTTQTEIFYRHEHVACSWRQRYKSVQALGKVFFIDQFEQKVEAMSLFMQNFRSNFEFQFSKPSINNIIVFKVEIESWSGRSFEY
mgnify:CR=1 FL=1